MKPIPPTWFFLCGLPFAGKSTLASARATRAGALRRIAPDAINTECDLGLDGAAITPISGMRPTPRSPAA